MRKLACAFLLLSSITVGTFGIASARSDYLEEFNDKYGTRYTSLDSCSLVTKSYLALTPMAKTSGIMALVLMILNKWTPMVMASPT